MDLTGKKFGRWTVLQDHLPKKKCLCRCECGAEKLVSKSDLIRGKSNSCGCLRKELNSKRLREDLTGQRFGSLVVLGVANNEYNNVTWHCICDCGKTIDVRSCNLKDGSTKSCGCLKNKMASQINKAHGYSHKERLYGVWQGMRERCNNPNTNASKNYHDRGITICEEWNDYEAFRSWSFQNGYNPTLPTSECTIDRIDNSKGYSPDNCRWVSARDQALNCQRNTRITYDGKTLTYSEWEDETGIPQKIIRQRIVVNRWPVDKALTFGAEKYIGRRRAS